MKRDPGHAAARWRVWRASLALSIGVLSLGFVSFLALLPAKGAPVRPAARETVSVTPTPSVSKAMPPSPSPEPEPPPPAAEIDCAAVACVALTFDDGPSTYTSALLDRLAELEVRVTFFNTGQNSANHPDLVKRQVDDGHLVGGHSWNHTDMKKQSVEQACADADRTARAIRDASGFDPPFVRPPYGSWNDAILRACSGKDFILWDVDTMDWSTHDAASITEHAVNDPKPGSIILMHDTVAENIDALPGIVAGLRGKGYQLVTVAGLFNHSLGPDQAVYSGPRTGVLAP